MRHVDLDEVAAIEPLAEDLTRRVGPALAAALGREVPSAEVTAHAPLTHGRQTTLHRTFRWRVPAGDDALVAEIQLYRFVSPPHATVNNTAEVVVHPESPRARAAGIALAAALPALGLGLGALGWRLLQYDTNMPVNQWMIAGALVGAVIAFVLAPRLAPYLGALWRGEAAVVGRRGRLAARAAVTTEFARIIDEHRARSAALPAVPLRADLREGEPAALAAFVNDLSRAPDDTILAHGLYAADNRAALGAAFAAMETDPERWGAYLAALTAPNPAS